jgi:hypothetical protein
MESVSLITFATEYIFIKHSLLRGDFLQTRVFGAQNQSDCRNAEKAIEQCWQYGGVDSCRGVCRLKIMQFLTQMTTGWEDF